MVLVLSLPAVFITNVVQVLRQHLYKTVDMGEAHRASDRWRRSPIWSSSRLLESSWYERQRHEESTIRLEQPVQSR